MVAMFIRNRETRKLMDVHDLSDMVPLHAAAENGHLEVVRELLHWDANIMARDIYENTPLHHAAKAGKTK